MNKFLDFWQHIPLHTSPVLTHIGPLEIRYYGLMYGVAFLLTYLLVLYRIKKEARFKEFTPELVQWCMILITISAIIGARVGYVIFYNFNYFIAHPFEIISPVQLNNGIVTTGFSGMSYHGGLIGAVIGALLCAWIKKIKFFKLADLIAPVFPLGFAFGRFGNFFNGELWGRVTNFPLGMYFPNSVFAGEQIMLRHASQLYEAVLEGILLFAILWLVRKTNRPDGFLFGLYLIGYGVMRTIAELFREPDAQLGFLFGQVTMGQVLSFLMIVGGALLIGIKRKNTHTSPPV